MIVEPPYWKKPFSLPRTAVPFPSWFTIRPTSIAPTSICTIRADQRIFAAVLGKYRTAREGHRTNGVKNAGDTAVAAFGTGINIAVAVVMIDAQPEYQTITALVMAGKLVAAEKRGERVAALLHRKHGVFFNLPHGQKSIAGCN